jgi:hypothetical protein
MVVDDPAHLAILDEAREVIDAYKDKQKTF